MTTAPDTPRPLAARLRQRLRRIPLSREGLFWFLIALAMLVTGLVKSIHLITLLAWLLIVLVLWNFWVARRQLLHVRVRRLRSEPIFALSPHRWAVQLRNPGRR